MTSCEFSLMITGIACTLAEGKTIEELELMAAFFNQLGETLGTQAAYQTAYQAANCEKKE